MGDSLRTRAETKQKQKKKNHVGLKVTFLTALLLSFSGRVGTAGQHQSVNPASLLQRSKESLPWTAILRKNKHFLVSGVYFLLKLACMLCSCLIRRRLNDIFIVSHMPRWTDRPHTAATCPPPHTSATFYILKNIYIRTVNVQANFYI